MQLKGNIIWHQDLSRMPVLDILLQNVGLSIIMNEDKETIFVIGTKMKKGKIKYLNLEKVMIY